MKIGIFSNLKNDSGTTLVELLAAIAILSLIVVSFLGVFVQGDRTNTRAIDLDEITYIAQGHMEQMINYSQTSTIEDLLSKEGFSGSSDVLSRSFNEDGYDWKIDLERESGTETLYSVTIGLIDEQVNTVLQNRLAFRMRETE